MMMEKLDNTWFESDIISDLYALSFVKRDERKLAKQKRQLFLQVASGYQVNYTTENMQKGLARVLADSNKVTIQKSFTKTKKM